MKASERALFLICVLLFLAAPAYSQVQNSGISFAISPDGATSSLDVSSSGFTVSPGARIAACFGPRFTDYLQFRVDLGYSLFLRSGSPFSLFDAGGGVGTRHSAGRFGFDWSVFGGGSFGLTEGGSFPSTFNPYVGADAGVSFFIFPELSIGLKGFYRTCFPFPVFQRFGAVISAAYHFPRRSVDIIAPPELKLLELLDVSFDPVFPVFRKYYDNNPIGSVTVKNTGNAPATDIRVSLNLPQYMDAPKSGAMITSLVPGEKVQVALYALFTDRILEITEDTLAAAEVGCTYASIDAKARGSTLETVSLRIHDRNSMTWEDDRRVAAFVTRKDPVVLTFAKTVTGYLKDEYPTVMNPQLVKAAAIFDALGVYGMHYEIDPSTPMSKLHQNKTAIDFLQFPKQTLEYRAGDCDDLTILYTALLEALGIETAAITTPGHILAAFATGLNEGQAKTCGWTDYIVHDGGVWIPVEITAINGGFSGAWRLGAQAWRGAAETGGACF